MAIQSYIGDLALDCFTLHSNDTMPILAGRRNSGMAAAFWVAL